MKRKPAELFSRFKKNKNAEIHNFCYILLKPDEAIDLKKIKILTSTNIHMLNVNVMYYFCKYKLIKTIYFFKFGWRFFGYFSYGNWRIWRDFFDPLAKSF